MISKTSKELIARLRGLNRAVWGLVLAVAAFLVSVALMILPLLTTSVTYQWNPTESTDSGAFPLDRSWPQTLMADTTFRCGADDRSILSTGGFSLYCTEGTVYAKSGKTRLGPVPASDGDSIRFTFKGHDGIAVLSNRSTQEWSSAKLSFKNFPVIRELNALTPALDNLTVAMTTRPSSLDFDLRRWILAGIAIGLAIGSAFAFRIRSTSDEQQASRLRSFWPQNLGVLATLAIAALAIPMYYDDGWVIQRVTQFLQTGYLGDFFLHSNAWLPQGFFTEFVLSLFIRNGVSYLGLRLIVVVVLWVSWLVVLATAVRLRPQITALSVWLSAAVFVSIAAVIGTSLRAESWVGLFTAACFYFVVRYMSSNSTPHLYGAGAFAGLAAATHQSGFVALLGFLVLVVFVLHKERWRPSLELTVVGIAVVASTLAFFFVGYDLTTVIAGARDFSDDAYSNRLDEFFRVGQIASVMSGARRFAALLAIALLALSISSVRSLQGMNRQLLIILMLSPFGLLLTSSKWGWHIAVLAIPAALLTLLLVQFDKSAEEWSRPRFSVILPVILLMAGVSLARFGDWGALDYSVKTWHRFTEAVAGPDTQWLWLGGALILAAIGAWLDQRPLERRKPRAVGASIAIIGLLFPSAASGAWIFADTYLVKTGAGLGWTILGQNVDELTHQNPGSCGSLGNAKNFTTGITPLVAIPAVDSEQMLMRPTHTKTLGFEGVDGWKTSPNGGKALSTSDYLVPASRNDNDTFALWFNSSENEIQFGANIKIVAHNADARTIVRELEVGDVTQKSVWSKIEFDLPLDTTSVHLVVRSNATKSFIISQPVIDIRDAAVNILDQGTIFIAPRILPSVPCAKLSSAAEGLFPATPFILIDDRKTNWLLHYFPKDRVSITELNETNGKAPGIGIVEYDEAGSITSAVKKYRP